MKRYLDWRKPSRSQVVYTHAKTNYPANHLHSLPLELILKILYDVAGPVPSKTLLSISMTCSKLHSIVNEYFLYRDIQLSSTDKFHEYCAAHLIQSNSLTKRFKSAVSGDTTKVRFLSTLHLVNPPSKSSVNNTAKIAGSYDVESIAGQKSQVLYMEFVNSLNQLLSRAKNLREIRLSEISPTFEFPDTASKSGKSSRRLAKLILSTQTGWSLPFKSSQITLILQHFGTIDSLTLQNFIIDEQKLTSTASPSCKITQLCLNSCKFIRKQGSRKPCDLFSQVSDLKLKLILTDSDLSLIDFVKQNNKLVSLSLDFNSGIFYSFTASGKLFNFTKFNHFFKLLCSRKGGFGMLNELTLVNFDLFDLQCADQQHCNREQQDTWNEPTPLQCFLSYVGMIPRLNIVLKSNPETCPLLPIASKCQLLIHSFSGKLLTTNSDRKSPT